MNSDQQQLGRLVEIYQKLPDLQRRILLLLAERLRYGVKRYGQQFELNRDLRREALEEALDASVYLAVEIERTPEPS